MITFSNSGDFKKMDKFLSTMERGDLFRNLERLGQQGVSALASATPVDSGATAGAWTCDIRVSRSSASIEWSNGNVVGGEPLAIMLQYGHGTGTGGYVAGRDYINPAIKPIMDQIADNVWKAVKSA